jgi:hypothetical protein
MDDTEERSPSTDVDLIGIELLNPFFLAQRPA